MDTNTRSICVSSFNSGGMGVDKQNYKKSLCLFSDILCIQEHFLLDAGNKNYNNTYKLRQYFGESHDMCIKPAYKNSEIISRGRGSGGLAILWRKGLTKYVTNINSETHRIQAIKLNFPAADLLIVNLYFMVDPQAGNFDDTELMRLLAEVDRIILLAGDFNCDFNRNTPFVNIVRRYVDEKGLHVFWSLPDESENHVIEEVRSTYTSTVNGVAYSSCLDHFIGNARMYNAVTHAGAINSPDNHSGHLPIYTVLNVDQLNLELEIEDKIPRHSWDKANNDEKESYKLTLQNLLHDVHPPLECMNCVSLRCEEHEEAVDTYTTSICEALDRAASSCLPLVGHPVQQGGHKMTPGWTEYVKPYQTDSRFWSGVWRAAGSPDVGDLYEINRQAKMQYKYAVRRLKHASNNIQQDKLLTGLLNGGVNIFNEIKKSRGNTSTISSSVDGKTGAEDISNHFAEVYKDLYQKHDLGEQFRAVQQSIDSQIDHNQLGDLDQVNEDAVLEALHKLKHGKSDPLFSFNSDCLLNSGKELLAHVTELFKWFLRTGKIPSFLLLCTIVPIVKDNLGDITSSDNYRAIAIGSLLLKWFDWLVIILEGNKLTTDELQFGFQANSSTSMCTWAIHTVIDYYNRHGRPVYACSMDLSKAFDLVAWCKLFPELQARGISPLILRCLINIYSKQMCNVRWGNKVSQSFYVCNGVRQGAVSSPILFCVYINNLIVKLRNSTVGCQLNGIYLGIWVYADDIVLLSPSREGLQFMTSLCENYATEHHLKFSTNENVAKSKTKCIVFSNPVVNTDNICPIMLNNMPLPYVKELKHLGNILESNNSMSMDCRYKCAKFISKVHSLNQEFHYADPYTILKLYNIYVCDFYGSNLWNLYSEDVQRLLNSWNVSIRILFDLPRDTHRYFIEPISGVDHIKTILCSRFVHFVHKLENCKKLTIRLLMNLSKNDFGTVICKNLNSIANDCNIDVFNLDKYTVKENLKFYPVPEEHSWKIPVVKELLDIRSRNYVLDNFADHDVSVMINVLCSD